MRNAENIFFIFYTPRSGSTMLARLICEKSAVMIPPESNFITKLIDNKHRISNLEDAIAISYSDSKFKDYGITTQMLQEKIKEEHFSLTDYILTCLSLFSQKNKVANPFYLIGIKKGSYVSYFKELKELFPKCMFVLLIRDVRAVFNSQKRSIYSVTRKPFEKNPLKLATKWCRVLALYDEILQKYPSDAHVVKYEDIVQANSKSIWEVLDFLKVANTKKVFDYQIPERYDYGLHSNYKKEILKGNQEKYKKNLSKSEIQIIDNIAQDYLKKYGYEISSFHLSIFSKIWKLLWVTRKEYVIGFLKR